MKKLINLIEEKFNENKAQWQARYYVKELKSHTTHSIMATNIVNGNQYIDSACLFSASNATDNIYLFNNGRYHSKIQFDTTLKTVREKVDSIEHLASNGQPVSTKIKVKDMKNEKKLDYRLTLRAYIRDYVKEQNENIVNAGSKSAKQAEQLQQARATAKQEAEKAQELREFLLSKLTKKQRAALSETELEEYGITV